MILLGLLLMLGAIAFSSAVIWANQDAFEKSAGTFTLLGYTVEVTVTQIFLAGLIIGALGFMGIVMTMSGAGRRARRRAVARRRLREREDQLREQESRLAALQREHEMTDDARRRRADEPARDESARDESARDENLASR